MKLSTKTALIYSVLALLTVWPAVQIWLVEGYGVSPWKLGAWGMYSAPRPKYVGMELFYLEAGSDTFRKLDAPTDADRSVAGEFLNRYRWLGRLAFPDEFARTMLATHPEWQRLRVVLSQPILDRSTGMIIMKNEEFEQAANAVQ